MDTRYRCPRCDTLTERHGTDPAYCIECFEPMQVEVITQAPEIQTSVVPDALRGLQSMMISNGRYPSW